MNDSGALWFWLVIVGGAIFIGGFWNSRLRFAMYYGVPMEKIVVQSEPPDCDFMTAPLGRKNGHYDKVVNTVQIAKSKDGGTPIMSFDDGKTWEVFTADPGQKVPDYPQTASISVQWVKVSD